MTTSLGRFSRQPVETLSASDLSGVTPTEEEESKDEAVQEPEDQGGRGLRGLAGSVLGGALTVLDAPLEYTMRPIQGHMARMGVDPRAALPWKSGPLGPLSMVAAAPPLAIRRVTGDRDLPWLDRYEDLIGRVATTMPQAGRQLSPFLRHNVDPDELSEIQEAEGEGRWFADQRAARERLLEDDLWNQIGMDALSDPLNLVGVGLVGRLGQVGRRVDDVGRLVQRGFLEQQAFDRTGIGRTYRAVRDLDDLAGRAFALPITLPVAGIRRAYRPLDQAIRARRGGRGLFDRSIPSEAQEVSRDAVSAIQRLQAEGISPTAEGFQVDEALINLRRSDAADIVRRGEDLAQQDELVLAKAFDELKIAQDQTNLTRVREELSRRGLLDGDELTPRLQRHVELDDTFDLTGRSGVEERVAGHAVLDLTATAMHASNPRLFPTLDDAYRHMNIRRVTADEPMTGRELFQQLDQTYGGPRGWEDELAKFESPDNIANLLLDERLDHPGLWRWYADSAEFLHAWGFDYSRAFTDEEALRLLNEPRMQQQIQQFGWDPEQVLLRLQSISKIEAITQLIGAGSMNEGPRRNLYMALRAYRNVVEGVPDPLGPNKIAFDMKGQSDKAYAGLAHPDGLLEADFLRRGRIYPDQAVHGATDKMHLFARLFREEVDAVTAYHEAIRQGMSPQEAAEMRELARQASVSYVSDQWDKRGMVSLANRLQSSIAEEGQLPTIIERGREKPFGAKHLLKRTDSQKSWYALKHFIHNDLFPYLTGRARPDGTVPDVVHPQAELFRGRYANPGALQADLWARFRAKDSLATQAVVEGMRDPAFLRQLAGAMPGEAIDPQRLAAGFRHAVDEQWHQVTPEQLASRYGTGAEQSFATEAGYHSATFSTPEQLEALRASGRLTPGRFQTRTGDVLETGVERAEAFVRGEPPARLMQAIGDDLIRGLVRFGDSGVTIGLTRHADPTTPIHEMLGHVLRRFAGPEDQRVIAQALQDAGVDVGTREGEEFFARAIERALATGQITSPAIAGMLQRIGRTAQSALFRGAPSEQLSDEALGLIGRRMAGEQVPRPPIDLPDINPLRAAIRRPTLADVASRRPGLRDQIRDAVDRRIARSEEAARLDPEWRGRGQATAEARVTRSDMEVVPRGRESREVERQPSIARRALDNELRQYGLTYDEARRLAQANSDDPIIQRLSPEVRAQLQSPDILYQQTIPATPRTAKAARELIESGDYVAISAERSNLSAAENTARTQDLEARIRQLGYEPIRQRGVYGGSKETSFLVPGMSADEALSLGRQFDQESILHGRQGLVYHDGTVIPPIGRPKFKAQFADNFSELTIQGRKVRFQQDLDFDNPTVLQQRTGLAADDTVVRQAEPLPPELRTPPSETATVREVLDQIASEIGARPEDANRVTELLEPLIGQNPKHFSVFELWVPRQPGEVLGPREYLELALREPDRSAIHVENAMEAMDQFWSAFGVRLPKLWRLVQDNVPERFRPDPRDTRSRAFGVQENPGGLLRDDDINRIRWLLGTEEGQEAARIHRMQVEEIDTHLRAISERTGVAYHPERTNLQDVIDMVAKHGTDAEQTAVRQVLREWGLPTTPEDALKFRDSTLREVKNRFEALRMGQAAEAARLRELGRTPKTMSRQLVEVSDSDAPVRLLDELPKAWREQALMSVRYHSQNVIDMGFKTVIFGLNPIWSRESAQMKALKWGQAIPEAVVADPWRNWDEFARVGAETGLGRVLGRFSDRLGEGAEKLVNINRGFARMYEAAARQSAWAQAKLEHLQRKANPVFFREIRRLASNQQGFDVEGALRTLHRENGLVSSEDVRNIIRAHGGSDDFARDISTNWSRALSEADEIGIRMADRVHFDYSHETVLEEMVNIRRWTAFHFWATRNIPFYLDTLAQHPWIIRNVARVNELTEQEREQMGLPGRFQSRLPIPQELTDPILSTLFGIDGQVYVNPLVIASFFDQMKPMYRDPDMPTTGRVLQEMGRVGLQPLPWWDYALQITGYYGDREPWGLLRTSGLIEGVTGRDIEQPLTDTIRRARGRFSGILPGTQEVPFRETVTGNSITDYLIWRKISDMSIRETGQINHPAYVAAMADPESEIFRRAQDEVQRERLHQQIHSFIHPFPTTVLGPEERAIRGRRAETGWLSGQDFQDALAAGDLSLGYLNIPRDIREARLQAGLTAISGTDPFWHAERRRQIFEQYPELSDYFNWLSTRREGQSRSIRAYLAERG